MSNPLSMLRPLVAASAGRRTGVVTARLGDDRVTVRLDSGVEVTAWLSGVAVGIGEAVALSGDRVLGLVGGGRAKRLRIK